MDFDDGGAQRVNPVLWIAVEHDVADVKPSAYERMLEFIDIGEHFEGAKEEFVPDFFDGDEDLEFLSEWKKSADLFLRASPRFFIGRLWIDNCGDEQHGV